MHHFLQYYFLRHKASDAGNFAVTWSSPDTDLWTRLQLLLLLLPLLPTENKSYTINSYSIEFYVTEPVTLSEFSIM